MWRLFEELSEVAALVPPGGNTGSQRAGWSWTCLTGLWPPRLITFKLTPVLDSLAARKLRRGNIKLPYLCAEAGMHGLCLLSLYQLNILLAFINYLFNIGWYLQSNSAVNMHLTFEKLSCCQNMLPTEQLRKDLEALGVRNSWVERWWLEWPAR